MTGDALTLADMPWWTYVTQTAGGDTQARIGTRIGVTAPSIGRWAKGALPDPSTAAAFAREYGRPVLEAFVAAGYLTPREASERPARQQSLTTFDDQDLIDEVSRRLQELREGSESDVHKPASEKRRAGLRESRAATRLRVPRPESEPGPQSKRGRPRNR